MSHNQDTLAKLASWKGEKIYVGVDIGATNTRISVAKDIKEGAYELYKFKCDNTKVILDNFALVSEKLAEFKVTIAAAALDAAGPITTLPDGSQQVIITNWIGDKERTLTTKDLPTSLFPAGKSAMLNDLEAGCYGILALDAQNKLGDYFKPLFPTTGETTKLAPKNYMVLAMGTGLGVGCLFYHGGKHIIFPMEVGHCLVTTYGSKYEETKVDKELFKYISSMLYRNEHLAEFEDICSGRGLEWTYQFFTRDVENKPKLNAEQISAGAMNGDKLAEKAMFYHYKMLIRAAQNASIATNSKGVILSGDNQVHNKDFVFSHSEDLKKNFLHHPKISWIKDSPVLAQTEFINTMIIGCIYKAMEL